MDTYSLLLTLAIFGVAAGLWRFVTRPSSSPPPEDAGGDFVQIFRCDMGQGYDDSAILSLIGFLGSRGIRATYDAAYAGEGVVFKTYAVKVAPDQVEEGRTAVAEWLRQDQSDPAAEEGNADP